MDAERLRQPRNIDFVEHHDPMASTMNETLCILSQALNNCITPVPTPAPTPAPAPAVLRASAIPAQIESHQVIHHLNTSAGRKND